MAAGTAFTYFVPETMGKTLEELGGDDIVLLDQGVHSGYAFPPAETNGAAAAAAAPTNGQPIEMTEQAVADRV